MLTGTAGRRGPLLPCSGADTMWRLLRVVTAHSSIPYQAVVAVLRADLPHDLCDSRYGNSFPVLQMDLSVLYGGANLESAPLESSNGTILGSRGMPPPQSCQELQCGYRDSSGRAFNREDYGVLNNNVDRLDNMPSFHGASKLKGAPRKMIPGPQQKDPANVKRGYRQVLPTCSPSIPAVVLCVMNRCNSTASATLLDRGQTCMLEPEAHTSC